MNPFPTYTAADLARVLGRPARVIRRALNGVPVAGQRAVRGNLAALYDLAALPAALQKQLEAVRVQRGLATVAALFTKAAPWQPEIPWRDVCNEQQTEALKIQRALLPVLERHRSPILENGELVEIGLRNYAREFGAEISPERWRYLFNRTLERDRGLEQFHRPELFLPGNLKRAANTAPQTAAEVPEEFRRLHALILGFANPAQPSADEKALLWKRCFEHLQPQAESRRKFKRARLRLLKFMWITAPWLAASPNALRVALDRAIAAGREENGAASAFADGRSERRGVAVLPPYDPEQVALANYTAARFTGGRRAEAVRELVAAGAITDARIKQAVENAASKSHLPASLRAEMRIVPALQVCALGERATKKMVPPRKLKYDGIFSLTCMTGDDHTPDCYVAVPDTEGWFAVMRPQLIIVNDFRSSRIVGRANVPRPQYTAFDVFAAFKAAFKYLKAIPDFILREGGLWRKSNLVNSLGSIGTPLRQGNGRTRKERQHSPAEVEFGLERKGLLFVDTMEQLAERLGQAAITFRESYQPRSKPVEGIIRELTHICQRLPCYTGSDERLNCPEATRKAVDLVRGKKARPADVGMLLWDEWVETVDRVIAKYNATKQEGRRLTNPLTGEAMSPDEAFQVFNNTDDPPNGFDAQCEVLLARIQIEVEVKLPNIRRKQYPCGFVEIMGHTYCSEETGARIGQKLLAHFDPEYPESCTFSDLKLRHPFTVPRLEPNNALLPDPQTPITTAQAQRTIQPVRASYKAMETKFQFVARRALVSPLIKELNAHTKAETQAITERKQKEVRRRSSALAEAREIGLPAALAHDPEGVAMMKRAERAMAEAEDEAESTAAPAPVKKDYFLKPFNPGGTSK